MAATAIVPGRRIGCDAAAGKLVIEPVRGPFLGFAVLAAVAPLAIAWRSLQGRPLTIVGWAIVIFYGLLALWMLSRAFGTPRVLVDFEAKRVWIGGRAHDFADVTFETVEMATASGDQVDRRARTTVKTNDRSFVLFDLRGFAAGIPPAFDAVAHGEPLSTLEAEIGRASHHSERVLKTLFVFFTLLVLPGLAFAYVAVF
jgi:hypothetical protein